LTAVLADVVVIGAGPAGAAAATTMARRGLRIALVDKARFPRDKCCGDGLTTGALRLLESLGLQPSQVASWQPIADVRIRAPGGVTTEFPLPADGATYAASARRLDLDSAVVELARAAGVEVIDGKAVNSLDPAGAGIRANLAGGGSVRAWYAVCADGMWSPTRKSLGLEYPGYLGDWHAARQYFHGVGPEARHMWVWFEEDLLPGYAWSFPLPGGCANVGYGIVRRPGEPTGPMKKQWADVLSRPHIREVLGSCADAEETWKAWPIPARVEETSLTACGGRVLFAGDAARASDPMTGEGIAQALETGILAADVIGEAGPYHPERAAHRYRDEIGRGLAVDNRFARRLSGVLAHTRGAEGALRIAAASDWTRRNFVRWMFEDYPRAVVATPRRWRMGMLSRRGAFAPRPGAGVPQ
jgi:geranylgeranyl reductase family protein